ncbi:hemolysin [Pontibacillus chungwhensis BH030062]|uniref:Hemolysin n=1 Tax=Pontibacillus chungwhensis BH030062 TaxID=1385513 RepID=A0A0A2UWT4_9BACI|nr:CNNM domain-containing protein [Pontibacillus chungwhensis]KGP91223.1 hemolysin [Pontibacillus chungwhensis BH030062]
MLIAIIILIFVSAFFSGSETALTATNRMKLQTRANNHDKKAEKLLYLVSRPSEFITTILIGNNIANILLPTLVTILAVEYGINVGIASAVLTITIIIFAEVIPKSVAATYPDRIATTVAPIIRFFIIIFKPITIVLNKLTDYLNNVLSNGQQEEASISKEELRTMIDIAGSEGTFNEEESNRIKGVFDFQNLNVKDVLQTPRVDVEAIPHTARFEEVREIVMQHPYTRYPVFRDDMDDIIAVFHSKYLLNWDADREQSLKTFCSNEPLIVYEFQKVEWVLRKMSLEKQHMAIVLDEYGGTEGIITHEDIIEAMIGLEIEDELDPDDDAIVEKLSDTELICDGKATLYKVNSIFDTDIPEDEDVLAAYILNELDDHPEEGTVLERNNLTFKILEMDGRSISRVQIIK